MGDASVRRATEADVPAIEQLVHDAYEKYIERIGCKPGPMTVDYASALETARVWVLCLADRVIGVLVTRNMTDHVLVENVAVAPATQGQGFGTTLLDRAEQDAVELGVPQVRLYTNAAMTENIEFYPRRGFVETGRGEQHGFHRVFFAKDVGTRWDESRPS